MSKVSNNAPAPGDVLMQQVFRPAFFEKLAEYGFAPTSDREAQMMLHTGHRLMQAQQLYRIKQAEQNASFWDKAAAYLDEQLGAYAPVVDAGDQVEVRSKTARLVRNPEIVKAAVALQDSVLAGAKN